MSLRRGSVVVHIIKAQHEDYTHTSYFAQSLQQEFGVLSERKGFFMGRLSRFRAALLHGRYCFLASLRESKSLLITLAMRSLR